MNTFRNIFIYHYPSIISTSFTNLFYLIFIATDFYSINGLRLAYFPTL